jgi:hypothetical protein
MSHSGIFYLPVAITVLIVEEFREIKKYIVKTTEKISTFRYPYSFSDFGYPSFDISDVFVREKTGKNINKDILVAIPITPIEKERNAAYAQIEDRETELEINQEKLSLKQSAVVHKIRTIAKKNGLCVDKTYMNPAGEAVMELSQSLSPGGISEFDELFEVGSGEIA